MPLIDQSVKGCEYGHVGNGVNLAPLVNGDKTGSKLVYYYSLLPVVTI